MFIDGWIVADSNFESPYYEKQEKDKSFSKTWLVNYEKVQQ